MKILCLGASFTGTYLASNFGNDNTIKFLTRQPSLVKNRGFIAINSILSDEIDAPELILDTIPPVLDANGELSLPYGNIIDKLISSIEKVVYLHISSTSVYASSFRSVIILMFPSLMKTHRLALTLKEEKHGLSWKIIFSKDTTIVES